ncbi:MAG: peptidase [Treponema sp.]|nr:MAG: peptidase [Treponema sp.]
MNGLQGILRGNAGLFLMLIPPMLLSMYAQFKVKSTFAKYSKIGNSKGISGAQAAKFLLQHNGINDVSIAQVAGSLSDHYDPRGKVLRLSEPVHSIKSISAVGVAAHETGHAIQDQKHYGPLVLRSTLVPVANIGSSAGPYITIIGLFAGIPLLTQIGIVLFAGAVLFYLVTLPVEFDASHRALKQLEANAILTDEEMKGARKVLTAAALTYVASALTAMVNLARLVIMSRRRR